MHLKLICLLNLFSLISVYGFSRVVINPCGFREENCLLAATQCQGEEITENVDAFNQCLQEQNLEAIEIRSNEFVPLHGLGRFGGGFGGGFGGFGNGFGKRFESNTQKATQDEVGSHGIGRFRRGFGGGFGGGFGRGFEGGFGNGFESTTQEAAQDRNIVPEFNSLTIQNHLSSLNDPKIAANVRCCYGRKIGSVGEEDKMKPEFFISRMESKLSGENLTVYSEAANSCVSQVLSCEIDEFENCVQRSCILKLNPEAKLDTKEVK